MTISFVVMLLGVAWLAFANGANDNFKGVATLFASRTTDYRTAINWAMITTLAGSVAALLLGTALIKAFSGKGLVSAQVLADPDFLLSVTLAAAATVFLATRLGFPISTTHAIVGGLVGAGLIAPGGVELLLLGSRFALPLLIAPLLAVALTLGLYSLFARSRKALGVDRQTCVCIASAEHVVGVNMPPLQPVVGTDGTLSMQSRCGSHNIPTDLTLVVGQEVECRQRYQGVIAGLKAEKVLNALHFLTAGTVGFARGLQDTAKITGLLVGGWRCGALGPHQPYLGHCSGWPEHGAWWLSGSWSHRRDPVPQDRRHECRPGVHRQSGNLDAGHRFSAVWLGRLHHSLLGWRHFWHRHRQWLGALANDPADRSGLADHPARSRHTGTGDLLCIAKNIGQQSPDLVDPILVWFPSGRRTVGELLIPQGSNGNFERTEISSTRR